VKIKTEPVEKKAPPSSIVTTPKQETKPESLSIDINSLLSDIKATKAALQQQQQKIKDENEKKLLQEKQRQVLALKKREREVNPVDPLRSRSVVAVQNQINKKLAQIRVQQGMQHLVPQAGFMPPPLLLDESGREIDKQGKVISTGPKALVATAMINKRVQREKVFKLEKPAFETDPGKNKCFDPRMKVPKAARGKRSFRFVNPGTYVKKGQRMRTKLAKELLASARVLDMPDISPLAGGQHLGQGGEGTALPLGMVKQAEDIIEKEDEPVPDVEWWDAILLVDKKEYGDIGLQEDAMDVETKKDAKGKERSVESTTNINEKKITHLVEHPLKLKEPHIKPPPGPVPIKLTKAEQKKMRRRARAEKFREQQERVLLSLEPAPANRVRISNMYKQLGTEAVQDPTQIEKMVREEMAQRQKNHDDRNQARKLTPAQRKAKKIKKMKEDVTYVSHVALFKILNLTDERHRYKIGINAKQNFLNGCVILYSGCNLLVVEGGVKGIRRYKKLLLRRIDWNSFVANEDEEEAEEKKQMHIQENKCYLLWEGTVLKQAFKGFDFHQCPANKVARRFLKDRGVAHYWDCARFFDPSSYTPPVLN